MNTPSFRDPNPSGITLSAWQEGGMVWSSQGHWLLPLFELERFISRHQLDPQTLSIHDTIQGKAAAALCLYLGLGEIAVDLISDGALRLYQVHGKTVTYQRRTERIQCATEGMITDAMDVKDAYLLLRRKAGLNHGQPLSLGPLQLPDIPHPVSFHLMAGEQALFRYSTEQARESLRTQFLQHGVPVTEHMLPKGFTVSQAVSPLKEAAELALRRLGCYALASKATETLTPGEEAFVLLAKAIAANPPSLVLDDPLKGLSPDEQRRYLTSLSSWANTEAPTLLLLASQPVAGWQSCGVSG
jgi:zinc transport system ATP-binding protein